MNVPSRSTKDDIEQWLIAILAKKDIRNYDVEILGLSEKGDGYMGDITFVKVNGESESGSKKDFNFVVKHGKISKQLREKIPVRCAFENEINVYDKILPEFKKFQEEKNISYPFNNTPKCHGTLLFDEMEVLFLQNMKSEGYVLHDRMKPMNFEHVIAIIKLYGKLHAISYALRDQKPQFFRDLSGILVDVMKEFQKIEMPEKIELFKQIIEIAEEQKEHDIVQKISEYDKVSIKTFGELTDPSDPYAVIIHGDCWNNNFMFKYEDNDTSKPSEICFLDWQISRLASPVYDLSYFLFTCISYNDIHRFDEINNIYYDSLCNFMKQLGSDPEKMFPFEELQKQWIKFSRFGFTMMPSILRLVLTEKEEVPDITESVESGTNVAESFVYKVKRIDEYGKRALSVLRLAVDRGFI